MYIDIYYGCQAPGRMDSRVVYGDDEDAIYEGAGRGLVVQDEELDEDLVEDEESEGMDKVENDGPDNDDSKNGAEAETEGELVQIQSKSMNDADVQLNPDWSIAIKPTAQHLTCDEIMRRYGAFDLVLRINEWLHESVEAGTLPPLQFVTEAHSFDPVATLSAHTHRCLSQMVPFVLSGPGASIPSWFLAKPKEFGIRRYRAGRIRVIFKLPPHLSTIYPHPLVFLELFTNFSGDLNSSHRMHTISQDIHRGIRRTIVMPLVWVVAACHLVPLFSQFDNDFPFDGCDVLSSGTNFFFNHYSSNSMFGMVDRWRMIQDQAKEAEAAERRAKEDEARRIRADRGKAACKRLHAMRNGTGSI
ncbi:hypothetical protein RSOLAG22IIIB_11943 [Rhizoctonia solani]|uniref:Uncharacterized protein n=1 Tax=Rhizoctonia solani TaxID=456999 RepID=A0A0K6GB58_9AGAM|nr:hypothetical protein RSOLAG22IIIB_11943 [Rhizoctonia solani]